mgnify:CR=1 FL=1
MREFNALKSYPQAIERIVGHRHIHHRIFASYRGWHFFDHVRDYGYGGLIYDGRWKPVAQDMIVEYKLTADSTVVQLNCEKGYLLHEFKELGIKVNGIEPSAYARRHLHPTVREHVTPDWVRQIPADLLIALGVVYTLNLPDAMALLRKIESAAFRAFITLASYETEDDLSLFLQWSLLATTVLRKDEWLEVMQHVGYSGDYSFVNANTLYLREP